MKLKTKREKPDKEEQKTANWKRKQIVFLGYIKPTLRWFRTLFNEEENPLLAWRAYQLCRQEDMPVPGWVLKYFDEVANGLLRPQAHRKPNERTAIFIQKTLKMDKKGKGSVFKRYIEAERKIDAVSQILELLQEGETIENAISQISEKTGISDNTLKKWYYHYKENLQKPA